MTFIPIVIGALGTVTEGLLVKGLDDLEMKTSGDNPNYRIMEIGQNIEKSPGDLRLAIIQTLEKHHQITLMWKTLKE